MSLLEHAPALTIIEAADLAREFFGVEAAVSPLPSERDQNFRLETRTGQALVLKIANGLESRAMLEAQNAAMRHVAAAGFHLCPHLVPAVNGQDMIEHAGHRVRLVTYLPGVTLGSVARHSSILLVDLGLRIGELTTALRGFDHPAAHREFHWDVARAASTLEQYVGLVEPADVRALVERVAAEALSAVDLDALPRSVIHNDANDYNILVGGGTDLYTRNQNVTGIIDFGDMLESVTIADLAVAIAYAILGKPDPLRAAATIVRGYRTARELTPAELHAIWPLVQLRLCMSVAIAADQQRHRPEDEYLGISQAAIRATLPAIAAVSFDEAARAFDAAAAKSQALARRRAATGRNVRLGYADPLQIVRGAGQYLYDESGRPYLDAYNNVPHVGHAHPRVTQAVAEQMAQVNTNTRYLYDSLGELAAKLVARMPAPLRVCFFVNSGSEANELALRLARAHTRERDLLVTESAYHGNTTTLIEISPYKFNGPGGEGAPPWVHVVPIADPYRGRHRGPGAGPLYARDAANVIDRISSRGRGLCGFIAETCPSVAGQIMFPAGYLDAVYRAVRSAGGVCIADEVQTAYGRMGTGFAAFSDHDVVPDIVVLGKPMGNGFPLGAVITTEAIAASFDTGMEFFSTFGGSTVACAAGLAVIDIVEEEGLQRHAGEVGGRLLGGLRAVAERHPIVGDVRGLGLFVGVELIRDREALAPATEEAAYVVNRLREEGILIGSDGPDHNVLKIRPPMPFTVADATVLVETVDRVLGELEQR